MSASLYAQLDEALAARGCDIGAAECHGVLCGMLCGPGEFELHTWLAHISGQDAAEAWAAGADGAGIFGELVALTDEALAAADYSFWLLLPDDAAALDVRAAAFAAWCRGFLSGVGLTGASGVRTADAQTREFLADLERFGRLDVTEVAEVGDEDDERAFVEVTEFARMGVLVLRAELRGAQPGAGARPPPRH